LALINAAAHKFTRNNDFSGLGALSRNFFALSTLAVLRDARAHPEDAMLFPGGSSPFAHFVSHRAAEKETTVKTNALASPSEMKRFASEVASR
jgi:hypothetical protein